MPEPRGADWQLCCGCERDFWHDVACETEYLRATTDEILLKETFSSAHREGRKVRREFTLILHSLLFLGREGGIL